MEPVSAANDH